MLLVFVASILYAPDYLKRKKLRRAKQELKGQTMQLRTEVKDLEDKLRKDNKNDALYEKIARDELGVVKEGEVVIDIKE